MNNTLLLSLILVLSSWSYSSITRAEYYPVFKGDSSTEMEKLVEKLEPTDQQKAYLGALKMKLAGLQKGPSIKLKTFKEGRELLETEIKKEPQNIEWLFLRLAVQENAPKIVKYSDNLSEDSQFISNHFSSAPLELQKIIKNYTSSSTILKVSDFK